MVVNVHPDVHSHLEKEEQQSMQAVERLVGQPLVVKPLASLHHEQFELYEF